MPKIAYLVVKVEPFEHPTAKIIHVKVKPFPGEEIHTEFVMPDNAVDSMWDIIWRRAGQEIENRLRDIDATQQADEASADLNAAEQLSDLCPHGIWIRDCWECRNGGRRVFPTRP